MQLHASLHVNGGQLRRTHSCRWSCRAAALAANRSVSVCLDFMSLDFDSAQNVGHCPAVSSGACSRAPAGDHKCTDSALLHNLNLEESSQTCKHTNLSSANKLSTGDGKSVRQDSEIILGCSMELRTVPDPNVWGFDCLNRENIGGTYPRHHCRTQGKEILIQL